MANVAIETVGPSEVGLITELYNAVFSPARDEDFFRQRFRGRYNVCMMVAMLEKRHAGFAIGFELMPSTFFAWLVGVLPDYRRAGIGKQLSQAQCAWAKDHEYSTLRFECLNRHRPMLHLATTEGYDIVGIRWDTSTGDNVVIFEKDLQ